MPLRSLKLEWKFFAILASLAALLTHVYFLTTSLFSVECQQIQFHTQQEILNGTYDSYYRYRVLVPLFTEGLVKIFSLFLSHLRAFLLAYLTTLFCTIFLLLSSLFIYLKQWFTREQSLVGVLFVAVTMTLALRDHCYQPWSLLEPALFSLALLAMFKRSYGWLALVSILAMANRETGFFIPLLFLFTSVRLKEGKTWVLFFAYSLLCVALYAGLHLLMGNAVHSEHILGSLGFRRPFSEAWDFNRTPIYLRNGILQMSLFFGVFWVFALLGVRWAPSPFLKKALWVALPYLFLNLLYNNWYEVRPLMSLYPIFVPLALSYVYRPSHFLEPQSVRKPAL